MKTSLTLSLRARLLRHAVRWMIYPLMSGTAPLATRRKQLEFRSRWSRLPLPGGTEIERGTLNGIPVDWITNRNATPERTVLYLHGGAYALGSRVVYREFAAHLARAWRARIVLVEYRLAPEHPFPAATEDAINAYRGLLDEGVDGGDVVIAGDSAGGGLTLACAIQARDAGLPLPRALVLFSPWVDTAVTGTSALTMQHDDMLDAERLRDAGREYAGGTATIPPLASPLHADLHGLPPVFIQATDNEILYDDARRLHAALLNAKVSAQQDIWSQLWHVWILFAGKMPEADAALARARAFLDAIPAPVSSA